MAQTIEKRLRALERTYGIGGGDECPECGGPSGGGGGRTLIVIRDAVTGEFCWAELDGEKISEDELREIEDQACSTCRGPTIRMPPQSHEDAV